MTPNTTEAGAVLVLDPNEVLVNPANARKVLRDIPQLATSIRQHGVIEPVVVRRVDENGTYMLIAGQRRRAAAIVAKVMLPAIVREGVNPVQEVGAMLAENENRDALSVPERARAYQTAMDLGMEVGEIAVATGRAMSEVGEVMKVGASEVAIGLADRHDFTLDQAIVFAEFDGDNEALKRLTHTAVKDPGGWDHLVSRLRRDKAQAEQVAALTAKLTEQGVRIVTREQLRDMPKAKYVSLIAGSKAGKGMTAAQHKKCPGHVAFLNPNWNGVAVDYYCEDPAAHGHKSIHGDHLLGTLPTSSKSEAEKEAETRKRSETLANNKAMVAANDVRWQYLTGLVKGRGPTRGATAFVATLVMEKPAALDGVDIVKWETLTGKAREASAVSLVPSVAAPILRACRGEADYHRAMLTMACAAMESIITREAWRRPYVIVGRYLTFLAGTGYHLSDIEKQIVMTTEAEEEKVAKRRGLRTVEGGAKRAPVKKAAKPAAKKATRRPVRGKR